MSILSRPTWPHFSLDAIISRASAPSGRTLTCKHWRRGQARACTPTHARSRADLPGADGEDSAGGACGFASKAASTYCSSPAAAGPGSAGSTGRTASWHCGRHLDGHGARRDKISKQELASSNTDYSIGLTV